MIIRPALTRVEGGALFIGTPDGKNHFYHLWLLAMSGTDPEWAGWHFPSTDNPHLPLAEITAMKSRMTTARFRQEMEAAFEAGGGRVLDTKNVPTVKSIPGDAPRYIACDLAGFEPTEGGRKLERLDYHALAVVAVTESGWVIEDIIYGKWDVRETALRIVKAFRDYRPVKIGIEKGMAMNAVMPYLNDEQNRLHTYFNVEPLTHGNKAKTDRICWALQGRMEKGRLSIVHGDWNKLFIEQAEDFPSPLVHDDLLDAVAYIDQIADPFFDGPDVVNTWTPMDLISGY
jgi:hypothetical protein